MDLWMQKPTSRCRGYLDLGPRLNCFQLLISGRPQHLTARLYWLPQAAFKGQRPKCCLLPSGGVNISLQCPLEKLSLRSCVRHLPSVSKVIPIGVQQHLPGELLQMWQTTSKASTFNTSAHRPLHSCELSFGPFYLNLIWKCNPGSYECADNSSPTTY